MSVFTQAIYDRLANDATLIALLSDYNGSPAIFTVMPIPEDVDLPYIITEGEVSNIPFDTKNSSGREIYRDIRCYTEADGSAVTVETIAERIRTLFHNHELVVSGYDNAMLCEAESLSVAPFEDGVYGRIVTVRFIAMES